MLIQCGSICIHRRAAWLLQIIQFCSLQASPNPCLLMSPWACSTTSTVANRLHAHLQSMCSEISFFILEGILGRKIRTCGSAQQDELGIRTFLLPNEQDIVIKRPEWLVITDQLQFCDQIYACHALICELFQSKVPKQIRYWAQTFQCLFFFGM